MWLNTHKFYPKSPEKKFQKKLESTRFRSVGPAELICPTEHHHRHQSEEDSTLLFLSNWPLRGNFAPPWHFYQRSNRTSNWNKKITKINTKYVGIGQAGIRYKKIRDKIGSLDTDIADIDNTNATNGVLVLHKKSLKRRRMETFIVLGNKTIKLFYPFNPKGLERDK